MKYALNTLSEGHRGKRRERDRKGMQSQRKIKEGVGRGEHKYNDEKMVQDCVRGKSGTEAL